jgi:hypothetical protein
MSSISSFFTENAHLNDEAIALYVDAIRLNKVYHLPTAVLRHVADCKECKAEIVENTTLTQNEKFQDAEPHPYFNQKIARSEKKFSYAYRIAAVVIVGISIGFLFYYFRSIREEQAVLRGPVSIPEYLQKGYQGHVPSESANVQQKALLADNFAVSADLENLVTTQSRSASIQVISPPNDAVSRQSILFQWKTDGNDPLILKILSNKEKKIQSISVRESRYVFTQKIPPGLYYWKLESKGELLHVGKFFVK